MASMKDALEECFLDTHAWLKYLIFAVPVYFLALFILDGEKIGSAYALGIPVSIYFFGFALTCTNNVRKGNNVVLPSFNIFKTLWYGLKCLLAIAPFAAVGFIIAKIIINIFSGMIPQGIFLTIFEIVMYILFSSFAITSYVLYSRNFKLREAYDLKKIFTYCVDIIIALAIMFIILLIVDAILVLPVTYIIWLFVGIPSLPAIYAWSVIAVLNIAMIGHYMAQLDYEIIPVDIDEDNLIEKTLIQKHDENLKK